MPQVLLVDDDATQLALRATVLRTAGISVLTATCVSDALTRLQCIPNEIGAIITDHILPGDDGVGFVRELRRKWQFLPVVVITGLAEAECEYAGLNVGFLQKPCSPAELIDTARASLSSASAIRDQLSIKPDEG